MILSLPKPRTTQLPLKVPKWPNLKKLHSELCPLDFLASASHWTCKMKPRKLVPRKSLAKSYELMKPILKRLPKAPCKMEMKWKLRLKQHLRMFLFPLMNLIPPLLLPLFEAVEVEDPAAV